MTTITITVEGGMVTDVEIPPGLNCVVAIKDYDIKDGALEYEMFYHMREEDRNAPDPN